MLASHAFKPRSIIYDSVFPRAFSGCPWYIPHPPRAVLRDVNNLFVFCTRSSPASNHPSENTSQNGITTRLLAIAYFECVCTVCDLPIWTGFQMSVCKVRADKHNHPFLQSLQFLVQSGTELQELGHHDLRVQIPPCGNG